MCIGNGVMASHRNGVAALFGIGSSRIISSQRISGISAAWLSYLSVISALMWHHHQRNVAGSNNGDVAGSGNSQRISARRHNKSPSSVWRHHRQLSNKSRCQRRSWLAAGVMAIIWRKQHLNGGLQLISVSLASMWSATWRCENSSVARHMCINSAND